MITLDQVLTIIAILAGPIISVFITRYLDMRRFRQERRYSLYKTLMATRRNNLTAEHINALNLIELEFNDAPKVVEAWKDYFRLLCERSATPEQLQQWSQQKEILFTKLVYEITRTLKIRGIDQIDIMRGGYLPNYWGSIESEQNMLRQGLVKIVKGEAALPVVFSTVGLNPEVKTNPAQSKSPVQVE